MLLLLEGAATGLYRGCHSNVADLAWLGGSALPAGSVVMPVMLAACLASNS